ncbi:hypothetical protein [Candidatus Foliamicus sp.]
MLAALPTAVGGAIQTIGDPALRQIENGQSVTAPALRRFARSRQDAAAWRGAAANYKEAALGHLLLVEAGAAGSRDDGLARAEAALIAGLRRAPMDPYGWMRLVQVRLLRSAPTAEFALPLKLALHSGPREDRNHGMLLLTLEAGLKVWDELDDRQRGLVTDKAREAWRRNALLAAAAADRAGRSDLMADLLGL